MPILYLSQSQENELLQIYKLERLCHSFPWTYGILQDCLKVGYLCHSFRWLDDKKSEISVQLINDTSQLPCCEKLIGFMINHIILDECHLLNICIHPDFQGKGIAVTALKWFMLQLQEKQIRQMFLEVRQSNLAAIGLYEKLGFAKISIRKDYYPADSGREDAIIMKKNLWN